MTTEWAHLPNAVHIDRVIASALANSAQWVSAWDGSLDASWMAARLVARQVARYKLRDQGRDPAWVEGWDPAGMELQYITWFAAGDVLLALIAYDDCAYMLDSEPNELAILAKLGDNRASLLLPACKAFHSLKTIA